VTSVVFLAFVVSVAGTVLLLAQHYLPPRVSVRSLGVLTAWLLYVGLISLLGIVANVSIRPPGIAFILLPVTLFVVLGAIRSNSGLRYALAIPIPLLLVAQSYRIGVELFLHQLHYEHIVPQLLTYDGSNVDVFVGLSAPFAAWASTKGKTGLRLTMLWNIVGLLSLANVITRFLLTTPGPLLFIHTEVLNRAAGIFPYTYIPGFLAPLAVTLHILAIRAIRSVLQRYSQSPPSRYPETTVARSP